MGYKQANPSGRKGGRDARKRIKKPHKVICAQCKRNTSVPFKPVDGRPVYCRECFQK